MFPFSNHSWWMGCCVPDSCCCHLGSRCTLSREQCFASEALFDIISAMRDSSVVLVFFVLLTPRVSRGKVPLMLQAELGSFELELCD